jgi:hypothetical protein
MCRLMKHFGETSGQGGHIGLELGPAAPLDLLSMLGQAGREVAHLLLNGHLGAQTGIGHHVFAHPAPNLLVGVVV